MKFKAEVVDGKLMFVPKSVEITTETLRDMKGYGTVTLGAWTVTATENTEKSYSYYSKAWHRAHGPRVTISDRKLIFSRPWGKGTRRLEYPLKAWSGDFVARAVADLDLGPKKPTTPLTIRLNKAYDAVLIDEKRGYKFYQRTLLGTPVDWVIVSPLGMTYHDTDRANLIKGLHKKIRQQSRKLQGLVDWSVCRTLGFCKEGISEFCRAFGLDSAGSYTPEEIEKAVRQKPEHATPFLSELKTLANSLNYHYSI